MRWKTWMKCRKSIRQPSWRIEERGSRIERQDRGSRIEDRGITRSTRHADWLNPQSTLLDPHLRDRPRPAHHRFCCNRQRRPETALRRQRLHQDTGWRVAGTFKRDIEFVK